MKKIQIIFLVLVAILILIPLFRFDYETVISQREKRELATRPEIRLKKNLFNKLSLYFEDRIGLKYEFKEMFEKLNLYYQMENNYTKIGFYGKRDWLFYNKDNLFNSYFRRNLFTDDQLCSYSRKVQNMQKWCESNNIQFIYFIAPNKNEIYEEFYPYKRNNTKSLTEQIVERLEADGVTVIYPKDLILEAKKRERYSLYYERDTHWNKLGAYYGSISLVKKIKELLPSYDFPEISYEFTMKKIPGGDLENIIGTSKGKMTDYDVKTYLCGKENNDIYIYEKNAGRDGVITRGSSKKPKLIMFRDSFTSALEPYLSPYFSYAEYNWCKLQEKEKSYILEQYPDIVIFEVVERSVPNVLNLDFQSK
ncbi:MAG: hypothetical protein MJ196_02405 [Treponemataceae bacterium]|nr:hypothetical protein [Treponemataceae bacterium]